GVDLPNRDAARVHAVAVARELMRNRELVTRPWRLQVCDDYLNPCFEILFAEVDETIAHLTPEFRTSIEIICRGRNSLQDALCEVQMSLAQVKATLSRAGELTSTISGKQSNL